MAGRARVERLLVEDHARGDDADDVALDDAAHRARVLQLFAHRDPMTELGQLGQIAARRVVRDAAHGHRILLALVARGEGQIEGARHVDGVLVEHLVEVPEAKEHDRVGVARLDVEVLAHQRRGGSGAACKGRASPPAYFFAAAVFFFAGLGAGSGLGAVRRPLLREPRLELPLPGQAAHLHRPPIVPSSHAPAITVRRDPVKRHPGVNEVVTVVPPC